jgi:hypothetical protein
MEALTILYGLVAKFKEVYDGVVENKESCKLLFRNIDGVVESIKRAARHVPRDKALLNVEQAVKDATEFITKFKKRGWAGKAWNRTADNNGFVKHAHDITEAGTTLTMSLGGQMIIKQVWPPSRHCRRRRCRWCASGRVQPRSTHI